jgi:hypothetical protein
MMHVKFSRTMAALAVTGGILFAGISSAGSQSATAPSHASGVPPVLSRGGAAPPQSSVGARTYPGAQASIVQADGAPPLLVRHQHVNRGG